MSLITKHLGGSPYSIPGLKLDLNLLNHVKSVVKNGANRISALKDDSGQNNNALQGVQNEQPIFTLNAINGKPAARFDGVDDFFDLTNILPAGNFTLYLILNLPVDITALTAQQMILSPQAAVLPTGAVAFGNSSGVSGETLSIVSIDATFPAPGSVRIAYLTGTISAGLKIIKIKLNGSTTTISINGISQTVNLFGGGLDVSHSLININRIGNNETGFNNPFVGDLGRILYWNRTLSGDDTSGEDGFLTDFLIKEWA